MKYDYLKINYKWEGVREDGKIYPEGGETIKFSCKNGTQKKHLIALLEGVIETIRRIKLK